jgi:lipoyl(octanoyl) transferase
LRNVESNRTLEVIRRGETSYTEALGWQRELHAERADGAREDTLLLLTHSPVVTLGRGSDPAHLLLSLEEYERRGVEVHETDRGGDVTYHGPGQLVGYPIIALRPHGLGPRTFLRSLEESIVLLLARHDIEGGRVPGLTGVWVGREKVAAMGIRVSRGVTMHGFALNVSTDPSEFELIVPCGIRDRGVTSMERILGRSVDLDQVARDYPQCLRQALAEGAANNRKDDA